jgi:hypothetical protein
LTDEIMILGPLSGTIDLGPDQDLCDGIAIVLDAGPGYADYTWQDGSTEQTLTAFSGGNHFVTVTDPCFVTDTIYIDECGQSLSIREDQLGSSLFIHPNPGNGRFTIEFETLDRSPCTVEILDLLGKQVRRKQLTNVSGPNRHVLDISDHAPGPYFIQLKVGDMTVHKQLIKSE